MCRLLLMSCFCSEFTEPNIELPSQSSHFYHSSQKSFFFLFLLRIHKLAAETRHQHTNLLVWSLLVGANHKRFNFKSHRGKIFCCNFFTYAFRCFRTFWTYPQYFLKNSSRSPSCLLASTSCCIVATSKFSMTQ